MAYDKRVMIKDSGIIREPRGISWQNWSASCKDVLIQKHKVITVVGILLLALGGGLLFTKQAHSVYGHFQKTNGLPGIKLNLKDNQTTATPNARLTASVSTTKNPDAQTSTPTSGNHEQNSDDTKVAPSAVAPQVTSRGPGSLHAALCTSTAKQNAQRIFSDAVTAENTYHTTRLNILNTSSSFGSLLGGHDYSQLLNTENDRHKNAIDYIEATLRTTLDTLGC
jgi:hypothetical protein